MRKKWMMAGAGFGIGAVLLLVTGVTVMANTSGYDAYKTALKNTKAKTSLTAKVDLTVTDNGKEVLTGTSNFKLNQVLNSGSIAATMGNGTQTHSFHVFRQDGKVVFKNSEDDVYRVMEQNTPKWHREEGTSNPPKVDGFEICKQIRRVKNIPILMVSAKKEDIDKIHGLGLGADDYLTKPFSVAELVARVKAHLARYDHLLTEKRTRQQDEIRIRGIQIDKLSRKVFVNETEVSLTSKEYDLLLFFATHPNWVFSKDELFEKIWGLDSLGDNAVVTVYVSKLREKIEMDSSKPQYIETIWGIGYRLNL